MSLKILPISPVPDETARIARAAFPHGAVPMQLREVLGTLYSDTDFADLFPARGQPAEAPWRLALVTVLQYLEGLTDRQAADAVRGRLDWKYALSLEITDAGFNHTVLSEFRTRLVQGQAEQRLFDLVLDQARARGWLKARGRQRTDSTHVLAAVRALGRLECVGETLRHTLNVLADVAPDWLRAQALPQEWVARYGRRVEEYRLPKGQAERQRYANVVGADGWQLLDALEIPGTPAWLREVPAVQTLRRVWRQQYHPREPDQPDQPDQADARGRHRGEWRAKEELLPSGQIENSPYDPEARYGKKRETSWVGYKLHVTETCDPATPHLIVQVTTTPGAVADETMLIPIQEDLARRDLLPETQLVDSGYIDADVLATSHDRFGVDVLGPTRGNFRWQAQEHTGFEGHHFTVDWDAERAICPHGHPSTSWTVNYDRRHGQAREMISVRFAAADCLPCPSRELCTRQTRRTITLHPREQELALRHAREQEQTDAFAALYGQRAGVEGTHTQGLRVCDLRHARYLGQAKTHLQHLIAATALNLLRICAWLDGTPTAPTRQSAFTRLMLQAA